MAYSNMVTEMCLIKLFIYKGKGKARGNQQGLVQYFGFIGLSLAGVCLWREEREEILSDFSLLPPFDPLLLPPIGIHNAREPTVAIPRDWPSRTQSRGWRAERESAGARAHCR